MAANMNLRFGKVTAVWPQRRCVEITYSDDGWREADVPVLNWFVSTDTGSWSMHNLHRPPTELDAGGLQPDPVERDTIAMIATVEGRSVVIGFIPPPLSQLMFTEDQQDRDVIWRHPSGTLIQLAPDGSYEFHHTGGAYIRVGFDHASGPADEHEDLTPFGANENWELPKNDPPTITVVTEAFKARVRPGGDTLVESGGNLEVFYTGNGTVKLGGNATVHVAGTADVSAGGDITVQTPANATVSAGGDATLQAVGNATVSAGNDATVRAGASASVHAAGSAEVAAGGDTTVAAVGSATVAAGGDAKVGAAGAATVAAVGSLTLGAPEITAVCANFLVTGVIEELGQVAGGIAGAALGAEIAATGTARGAAAAANGAAALPAAEAMAAKAEMDAERATEETEEHAELARESSRKAQGTGARVGPGYSGAPGGGAATGGEAQA